MTSVGIVDVDAKPGDILIVGIPPRPDQVVHVLSIDADGLAKADRLFGAGSVLAIDARSWIHDEAARRFMEYLDPMSWFGTTSEDTSR